MLSSWISERETHRAYLCVFKNVLDQQRETENKGKTVRGLQHGNCYTDNQRYGKMGVMIQETIAHVKIPVYFTPYQSLTIANLRVSSFQPCVGATGDG